jgi:hypothetical protein
MNTPAELRAITVRPPWSWAITRAGKTVENRPRPTSYRGQVAIHAGSRWDAAGAGDGRIQAAWMKYRAEMPRERAPDGGESGIVGSLSKDSLFIELGAIVAVANLVNCHLGGIECARTGACRPWGDFGSHHLVLADARPLARPVICRGWLAVPWRVPDDAAAEVLAQLTAGAAA